MTRRAFLAFPALAAAQERPALIAITLDLEMARNYPTWEQTEWDYEKGNLDEAAKRYAVEAARRVRRAGGVIHFFLVGRVLEQPDAGWLQEIVRDGHPVGNHTYDHVNIRSNRLDALQPRFRRAPWLLRSNQPLEAIADNIRMTAQAMKARLGIEPAGFRSPGGFPDGLADRPDVQRLLLDQGYTWASTKYVNHPTGRPGYTAEFTPVSDREPSSEVYGAILRAQEASQPMVYNSGLIEIPMCPVSDLIAFRTGRWRLEDFLKAIRVVVVQAIERRQVFVLLGHPSCLSVEDPSFRTVDLISTLVKESGGRARLVGLDEIARRAKEN